ncbi:MAG: hypothetical protein ACTSXH_18415 [Promethearchaeota archaeon]
MEIYKGNKQFAWMTDEQNAEDWFNISSPKGLLNPSDVTSEYRIDYKYFIDLTWIILQFVNGSNDNLIRFRIRYEWNISNSPLQENYTVTIDEFAFNLLIQNAKSSDITLTIGLGLDSKTLKPSDIKMKNNGEDIKDSDGFQKGIWEKNITEGEAYQGYYIFNVTSIWPEIRFDIDGIYQIETSHSFLWAFDLKDEDNDVSWEVSSDIFFYAYPSYTILPESRSLQVTVPKDWILIEIYNSTDPNQRVSDGNWDWFNETIGLFKYITVFNISDGKWQLELEAPIAPISVYYNPRVNVKLDDEIDVAPLLYEHYKGGTMYFEVYDNKSKLIYDDSRELNYTTGEQAASFKWDVYETTKNPGDYFLKTYWTFSNETHAFIALHALKISVSRHSTNLELLNVESFQNESIYGTKIIISGNFTYNETRQTIEGETIFLEVRGGTTAIEASATEKGELIKTLSDITNEEGLVQIEYIIPEGYSWIRLKLYYNTSNTYFEVMESKQTIIIITISQQQYHINMVSPFIPYMITCFAGFSVMISLQKWKTRKFVKYYEKRAKILDDILKIAYTMIIHKDAGTTIYSKQISMELDSDLIGGFLTAISQFRSEIKKEEEESEKLSSGFEMDYYDFKIVITDGKYVRVALILDGTPSEELKKNQRRFTSTFELKFKSHLEKMSPDVRPFKETDEIIENIFNISLVFPLNLSKYWELLELKPLEKDLIEIAQQIEKEKKFFFISNLLSYALAGRKESKNHIISTILSLKEKGVLVPIKFEVE